MEPEIITTTDGSHTLYVPELKEHYHSINGAIQESKHVFINAGLKRIMENGKDKITILEVGMGTGLNVILNHIEAMEAGKVIDYTTLEVQPLSESIVAKLNYKEYMDDKYGPIFDRIHKSEWNIRVPLSANSSLTKVNEKVEEFRSIAKYDLVYFDGFAPEVQPEIWGAEIFALVYDMMALGGILVTYCAKGVVKRAMKDCGFVVESIPGPTGKREMTRARK